MPPVGESDGPCFISAHSADVILSDIRPIKLKPEALQAINVLLDEFLSKILTVSSSLSTDKLRASLLSLLPTSLGKEALLEAEVELRAYWERTDFKALTEDDARTFHLEWAYALLRLKCEAYSTLNEQDEDPAAEARLNELFGTTHGHPPNEGLVDPAALYLTAILESMCEHVLSNVGRVAARDSSRTTATINDLFVALCEDDSIYGLFRLMNVYEQIELMSKTPKSRRSKSFSRSDRRLSITRTSSPQHDFTASNSSSTTKARLSTEAQSPNPLTASTAGSRTSFEKARAIKMFTNGKALNDADAQGAHKKSDSLRSENTKQLPDEESTDPEEDAAMQREFDDLMRSTSTMKVSLTPDRLKTMEVYKQEKGQRGALRRPGTHQSTNSEPDIQPPASRPNSQRQLLRRVDSIVEDDEEQPITKGRARQTSIATPPTASFSGVLPTRSRSVSTSATTYDNPRRTARSPPAQAVPSSFTSSIKASDMHKNDFRQNKFSDNGFPPRTRTKGRNRDSMDLDDIMNGSDDDQELSIPAHQASPRSPPAKRANQPHAVSAKTRELMDFLAEGPPETPVSKSGKELIDFLADGPPDYSNGALDNSKPKGAGRLQRMISKLNLGNAEKAKGSADGLKSPHSKQAPIPTRTIPLNHQPSNGALSSLANRPIPPRPPRPISPPRPLSPPASPQESSDENKSIRNVTRKLHQDASISKESSSIDKSISERASPIIPATPPVPYSSVVHTSPSKVPPSPPRGEKYTRSPPTSPGRVNGNGHAAMERVSIPKEVLSDVPPIMPTRTASIPPPARKPVPSVVPVTTAAPVIPENDVRDMQRLFASATTADECRLILDMFMARNHIPREQKAPIVPYPSPSPSVVKHAAYEGSEASLENSLVELFLGGSIIPELAAHLPLAQEIPSEDLPVLNDAVDINDNVVVPPHSSVVHGVRAIPVQV